jgi:arginine deiminase
MVPAMMEHLLFDDILYGEEAREEHDTFTEILRRFEVETLDAQNLLEEVIENPAARGELFDQLHDHLLVQDRVLASLRDLDSRELAEALVSGRRSDVSGGGQSWARYFDLLPVPNYFFQRDPQIVVGDRVVTSSMATSARSRESLISRIAFRHHPQLDGATSHFDMRGEVDPTAAPPGDVSLACLEGGDVLVVSPEILLVGISERTNRRGVEVLAEHLRQVESSFLHLIAVELPSTRAYMHLDTVFTIIDQGTCLGHAPVILDGSPETARIYRVDLAAEQLTFSVQPPLLEALAGLGLELDMVPCGGEDPVNQQREQWTDGANAFAVAPGVIVLYRRNRKTTEELAARGWRIIDEAAALAHPNLADGECTAITFFGNELSRARGGPRCMTMPLSRRSV